MHDSLICRFSGLMNGHQCYCGSHYGKTGPSDDCKMPCIDDPTLFCGSDEAINVYSTGQKGKTKKNQNFSLQTHSFPKPTINFLIPGPSPPRRLSITASGQDSLELTWQPPDIPNGKIVSYTLKATAIETKAPYPLPPIEADVQGEFANATTIYGLHPGTKYNISILAANAQGTSDEAYTIDWTRIGPPNKPSPPRVLDKSDRTITIEVPPGSSENGPLTYYHVVVVQTGTIPPTSSDVAYESYERSNREGLGYYITGKFDISDYPQYKRFEVGDGRMIGGYYNAPLDIKQNGQPQVRMQLDFYY